MLEFSVIDKDHIENHLNFIINLIFYIKIQMSIYYPYDLQFKEMSLLRIHPNRVDLSSEKKKQGGSKGASGGSHP